MSNNEEGKGKAEFYPYEVFLATPIPELATIILFSTGLLVLVGCAKQRGCLAF